METKITTKQLDGIIYFKYKSVLEKFHISRTTIESRVDIKVYYFKENNYKESPYIDVKSYNKIIDFINCERKYRVYRHTCLDGSVYIGQTYASIECRTQKEFLGYNNCPLFYEKIKEFGYKTIKSEILLDNLTKEEANMYEKALILYYKNMGISLNIEAPKGVLNELKHNRKIEKKY